jgi:hypothetical protein
MLGTGVQGWEAPLHRHSPSIFAERSAFAATASPLSGCVKGDGDGDRSVEVNCADIEFEASRLKSVRGTCEASRSHRNLSYVQMIQ